jgi:glycosyltransferase involved in cell wall biosynthesis
MKALLLSTSDIKGGAARAAYTLHQGLNKISVDSQILSQVKYSQDLKVIGSRAASGIGQVETGLRLSLDRLPLKIYRHRNNQDFSAHWLPDKINSKIQQIDPDIVNLHWISAGYVQIESIARFKKPLVWTLHDMWAFTGGCHYNQECQKYTASCGACPQLGSKQNWDLSRWVWQRKQKSWQNSNLTIVASSSWMRDCAKSSSLFKDLRIELIPYGIDLEVYKPINRQIARELLRLPQNKKLILFGSLKGTGDLRKGFQLLEPALQKISQSSWQNNIELVVFGASAPEKATAFGLKTNYLGTLNDELCLVLTYSAADVLVLPSVQDNLPITVMEALACGIPCVGFDVGGFADMVEHQKNGYLAQPYKIEDLANGIIWTIENDERQQKLSYNSRLKAEREYTLEIQANRYLSLFQEVLEHKN